MVSPGVVSIRSIPAWAGEPPMSQCYSPPPGVYPRVGGGTCLSVPMVQTLLGLSPRGRGNHLGFGFGGVSRGSIPAWAGEPPFPQQAGT